MSHASPPRQRRRGASRALAALPALVLVLAACGGVQTAACGLVELGSDVQADLESLLALDPAAVAVPGSEEQAAALAAVDAADGTVATAQETLDNATEDQVGPVIRTLFQAALDATAAATDALRGAIESGDANAVADAMVRVQSASDAFDAFEAAVADSNVDCPDASAGASASSAASAAPSATAEATPEPTAEPTAEPTETPEPTVEPTPTPEPTEEPTPTPEPTEAPTPTPEPTAAATPTAEPTPTATAEPTPTVEPTPTEEPTATPSASASASASASVSASASASASAEPSPSPSGEASGEEGAGPWGWIAALGVLAVGGLAAFLWYRNQNEPPPDDLAGPDDGVPPPPVAPGDIQDVEAVETPPPDGIQDGDPVEPPPEPGPADTASLGEADEPPPPPAPTSSGERPPG